MNSLWLALALRFQCKIFEFDCGCCLYAAFSITNSRVQSLANTKGTEKKNAKIVSKVNVKDVLLGKKKNENFLVHHSKRVISYSVLTEKCVS